VAYAAYWPPRIDEQISKLFLMHSGQSNDNTGVALVVRRHKKRLRIPAWSTPFIGCQVRKDLAGNPNHLPTTSAFYFTTRKNLDESLCFPLAADLRW
jgi:hypothetical protein